MLFKDLNLYINEKNIVTIQPYFNSSGAYGLNINGINYEFGRCQPTKNLQTVKLGQMKAYQTQIIKAINKND